MLDKITFEHFFVESKDMFSENAYLIRHIDPYSNLFFKSNKNYLALSVTGSTLHVGMVIGDGADFIHDLAKECKRIGVKYVTYMTSEKNHKMHVFSKYFQALKVDEIPDFYNKGEAGWRYQIDLEGSSRFI